MKSVWCLQFSYKLNGGNQALAAFFNELFKGNGHTLVLRGGISNLIKLCIQSRKKWVVVSDPLCAIFLFILCYKKVIHFIQSDDYNLFKERGLMLNFIYKILYCGLIKFSDWYRVFNSNYSRLKFNSRFNKIYSKNSIVPMLGLSDLFPDRRKKTTGRNRLRQGDLLWVGSKHAFKGGKKFVRAIERLGAHGTMLFSGEIPHWAINSKNIDVMSNLGRSEVYSQMKKAKCYVYTSSFDSFALPIFEALHADCAVIALTNECIQLNDTSRFIHVVKNITELEKALSEKKIINKKPKFEVEWKIERQRFINWINLNFTYLQSN